MIDWAALLANVGTALAAFFGTLTPSDWVTSGIALAALVVSAFAIREARRAIPRPRMEVSSEWQKPFTHDDGHGNGIDVEEVEIKVVNHGSGTAHDVRIVVPGERSPTITQHGAVAPNIYAQTKFNFRALPKDHNREIEVTWWQYPPSKGKMKSKRANY